ncbi:hypothetical protein [Vibrio sp. 11-4(1)]|uniref:hypothetical protein n=1 Tax=Vibrio sp. 11-4(1) TaxID=2591018 RepID=UPI00148331D0|nr:hypothetical protein [Vibrio sp. 11-4(1)]NNN79651.1 hypothetical protein [Vibrio sp. 11-4(1)]
MIKISNSCLVDKSSDKLDEISRYHLSRVNPLKRDGTPHQNSLSSRLINAKRKFLSDGYLVEHCAGDVEHQKRLGDFVDYFLSNNMLGLERVILSTPLEFNTIIAEIEGILTPEDWHSENGNKTDFYNTISDDVFTYNNYRQSKGCIDTYKKLLGEQAQCFYCNNNKLDIVGYENGIEKLFLDLDHFYLKSKYPYLALSFFNLIPCCGLCNSTVRGNVDFNTETHINPYENCFDSEYSFILDPEEIVKLNLGADSPFTSIRIVQSSDSIRLNDRTIDDLRLIERYRNEIPIINSLSMKYRKLRHLRDLDLESFDITIHGYKYSEIPKDPGFIPRIQMAKLKRDIIAQLSEEE